MNEMTLSSRHRIRNSSPGGLRPSTLPLGHGNPPQTVESYTYFYHGNFGIDLQTTRRACNVLIIGNFPHIFVFVGLVVHE